MGSGIELTHYPLYTSGFVEWMRDRTRQQVPT